MPFRAVRVIIKYRAVTGYRFLWRKTQVRRVTESPENVRENRQKRRLLLWFRSYLDSGSADGKAAQKHAEKRRARHGSGRLSFRNAGMLYKGQRMIPFTIGLGWVSVPCCAWKNSGKGKNNERNDS